jgi:hypothetical protein
MTAHGASVAQLPPAHVQSTVVVQRSGSYVQFCAVQPTATAAPAPKKSRRTSSSSLIVTSKKGRGRPKQPPSQPENAAIRAGAARAADIRIAGLRVDTIVLARDRC